MIGLVGLLAGLALPFAPVWAERTEVTWPPAGADPRSTTAILVPYRPATLTAEAPCPVLRAAAATGRPTTVLATGGSLDAGGGVLVRVADGEASVLVNTRLIAHAPVPHAPVTHAPVTHAPVTQDPVAQAPVAQAPVAHAPDDGCGARVTADQRGVTVTLAGTARELPGEPVPEVASFRTDLAPEPARGLRVTARPVTPFATSPTGLKTALLVTQLLAAAAGLAWLAARRGRRPERGATTRTAWWVDGGVLALLAGWAVIGPLTDDDGFATMIARNALGNGDQGNYYRWWNASETPFALAQQVLSPLAQVSAAPLWLRLPSTVLGAAVWFTLSRGVLGAIPGLGAHRARIRLAAAAGFLAGWLPYDLGVRPEPYVALGLTAVLALLGRARTVAGLGAATLVAALTVTAGPSGLLVLAPLAVFAGRVRRILRDAGPANVVLLAGIAAVASSVVFADQTLHGLLTATDWHTTFGPALPWSQEFERYRFLLGPTQDGSAAKRVPVLLAYALLPVVGVALARRGDRDPRNAACARLAGVVAIALGLLWLTPSKWSHHFGALAGFLAAFLVVGAVTLRRHAREQPSHRPLDRTLLGTGVVGTLLVSVAAAVAFAGPNAWWQPVAYLVWWPDGPVRPFGLPLDSPLPWLAVALGGAALARLRGGVVAGRIALAAAPGTLALAVAGTVVAVLLASFAAAPLRRPEASLAVANLHRLIGGPACGPADDVQALPDVPGGVLTPAPGARPGELTGFAAGAGFGPDGPPPEPPGTGASTLTWGSRVDGPATTGRLVSPWLTLPPLRADQELALTVSGRTDAGNHLALEFGTATGTAAGQAPATGTAAGQAPATGTAAGQAPAIGTAAGQAPAGGTAAGQAPAGGTPTGARLADVAPRGERELIDQPHHDPAAPPDPAAWRAAWLPADQVPPGADRVRVTAVDGSSAEDGWLALTGPRLRRAMPLTDLLAQNGPVLVNWPIAFLFPCVRDTATVVGGLVEAPRVVLEAPGRYAGLAAASTAPESGGDFAVLRTLGRVGEVPTRVAGHPELDWGSLWLVGYDGAARDRYDVRREVTEQPGWVGDRAQFITEGEKSRGARASQ